MDQFRYFLDSLVKIQNASNLACRLSRPKQVAETKDDLTKYAFGWTKHPDQELYVAQILKTHIIPIHPFIRESVRNNNGVSIFFDQFYDTPQEAQAKKDLIVSGTDNEGNLLTHITILDIIPDSWLGNEKTYAELEADGWFLEP